MTGDDSQQNINVLITLAMKPGKAKEMVSQIYNLVTLGMNENDSVTLEADGSVVALSLIHI